MNLDPIALGVATADQVDPGSGRIACATGNLPGWTGTPIAEELSAVVGLPVAVENDANALAVAEKHFGLAKELEHFVCITLGTGAGGGCYIGGRLNRGAHFFANSLGHATIQRDGLPCTCGRRGCLEAYTNVAALLRYARGSFSTAEQLVDAVNSGDPAAHNAMRTYASWLAIGAASIIELLDLEMLIVSGGLTQNNPTPLALLHEGVPRQVAGWEHRHLHLRLSELGYHGGVLGAAAVAKERLRSLGSGECC